MTKEQRTFCELYINGPALYAGDAEKCYVEVFNIDTINTKHMAKQLLAKPEIQEYLEELEDSSNKEAKYIKWFLTENLMHIIKETSTAKYRDRRGTKLSPAALRSVAVSASRVLMEMYKVKEANISDINVGDAIGHGITFNVIAPNKNNQDDPEGDEQLSEL